MIKIKKYIPVIGIAIFVYILLKLNISSVAKEIINARFDFLALSFLFIILSFFTSTSKWLVIARQQKMKVPFFYAFKINFVGMFYGFITPSKIGSILRVEYLKKFSDGKIGKGVSNYFLEKFLDLGSLFFLVLASSLILKNQFSGNYFQYALGGIIVLLLLFFIFRDEKRSKSILKLFYYKFVPEKIKRMLKDGFYSFYEDMPEKKYFILFFVMSTIHWIVLYSITFFMGLSVGINISYFYFLLFMPIATFIAQIPITINGLGTKEAAMISLFGLLGVSATKIFSMSVIGIFLNGIFPALIGLIVIFTSKQNRA